MSEIEEFQIEPAAPALPHTAKLSPAMLAVASAREKLTRFLPRAVEIIEELAEFSENDRVRLAAAESIADRVGLGKTSTIQLQDSQAEHDVAQIEVAKLLEGIANNQASITEVAVSLEALIVHEGEAVEGECLQ